MCGVWLARVLSQARLTTPCPAGFNHCHPSSHPSSQKTSPQSQPKGLPRRAGRHRLPAAARRAGGPRAGQAGRPGRGGAAVGGEGAVGRPPAAARRAAGRGCRRGPGPGVWRAAAGAGWRRRRRPAVNRSLGGCGPRHRGRGAGRRRLPGSPSARVSGSARGPRLRTYRVTLDERRQLPRTAADHKRYLPSVQSPSVHKTTLYMVVSHFQHLYARHSASPGCQGPPRAVRASPDPAPRREEGEQAFLEPRSPARAFAAGAGQRAPRGRPPASYGAPPAAGQQRGGGQLPHSVRDMPGAQPVRADAKGVCARAPPPAGPGPPPPALRAAAQAAPVRRCGMGHSAGAHAPAWPRAPRQRRCPSFPPPPHRSPTAARATSLAAPTPSSAGAPATTRATRRPSSARRWPRPRTCAR